MADYERGSLADVEPMAAGEGVGARWQLGPALELDGYSLNVAVLEPGERLPRSGYHYHDDQEECFYVVEGRCRAEVEGGREDFAPDDVLVVRRGSPQLIHNPFEAACKLLAVGVPASGHRSGGVVATAEELLAERYPGGDPASG